MAKILVIGRTGQLAVALQSALPARGHEVIALEPPALDLCDPASIAAAVRQASPALVINAAAYTAVDRAETEADLAFAINATGPEHAARTAQEVGAAFIQYSTDYVFDGSKGAPYLENDPESPLGVYGRTKLEGERRVASVNAKHAILRTAWLCSPTGSNFVKTMLRLAGERDRLRVVDDQRGSPTFATDIAHLTAGLINRIAAGAEPWGVFHATSQGDTTWCGFARAIMDEAAARGAKSVPVEAITTAQFPTPARRPADSRLADTRLSPRFGLAMPNWRDGLARCMDELLPMVGAGDKA